MDNLLQAKQTNIWRKIQVEPVVKLWAINDWCGVCVCVVGLGHFQKHICMCGRLYIFNMVKFTGKPYRTFVLKHILHIRHTHKYFIINKTYIEKWCLNLFVKSLQAGGGGGGALYAILYACIEVYLCGCTSRTCIHDTTVPRPAQHTHIPSTYKSAFV